METVFPVQSAPRLYNEDLRLLHNPALTEAPVYIRTKGWVFILLSGVWNIYISYLIPGRGKQGNLRVEYGVLGEHQSI
jgi:hypothetical protein